MADIKGYVRSLRNFRVYHRWIGIPLALFLLLSSITGILLSWKKDVDLLQPPTQKGVVNDLSAWRSVDELSEIALLAFQKAHPGQQNSIDRIDIRPSKGIAKVLMNNGWWEVQLDGSTGEILSIARRHSDWIEAIHDGSIIGDSFKLLSMNTLGIGLVIMVISGLWLWYGPKKIRRAKKRFG